MLRGHASSRQRGAVLCHIALKMGRPQNSHEEPQKDPCRAERRHEDKQFCIHTTDTKQYMLRGKRSTQTAEMCTACTSVVKGPITLWAARGSALLSVQLQGKEATRFHRS